MHLIGRSPKGKWAYDHVEEWAKDYVAQLRMYRKSRDSEMYREMQRIQILLRCGTTCYWIKDKTAKRICDPWKVSLVKWIRKQHGARRRHRLTHGYEVDDFVRRYRYCPRCDKRIILRILGQACPRCGYLPSSHAEYKINPVKVKGHERGPLGHHGPPPTRYIA